eukprot:305172_1
MDYVCELIKPIFSELNEEEYDTEGIVDDIEDNTQSNICNSCVNKFSNIKLFNALKQTLNEYAYKNKSISFKDMDFALSKYYSLMGRNEYFDNNHIGLFEIFCFHNGYITEQEIKSELEKATNDCILTKFDIDKFPFGKDINIDSDYFKTQFKRQEIHRVLKTCFQNKYAYDINENKTYSNQYTDSQCESVTSCTAVENIKKALEYQYKTDNKAEIYEYCTNTNPNIIKDFHHILMRHLNHANKLKNDKNFQIIYKIMTTNIECNVSKCGGFSRNNRNKEKKSSKMTVEQQSTNDDDNLEHTYFIDLLDNIHCYFIHSFDTGFRLNADMTDQIYNNNDDVKLSPLAELDFDSNDIQRLYVDNVVQKLKTFLLDKQKKITDLRATTNKFVTTINDNETNDQKQNDDIVKEKETQYAFGMRYYYWAWFKNKTGLDWRNKGYKVQDWYIENKYQDFKEEMLNYLPIKQFNCVKLKSTHLLNKSNVLKRMKSDFYYTDRGMQPMYYGIPCGEPLKISNIMCVLFYTDYSELSYNFSKSFRRLSSSETDECLKKRHSNYWHWGKILRETVELYGNYIRNSKVHTFYHGVSFIYFNEFVA